jgi:hypothetical protein
MTMRNGNYEMIVAPADWPGFRYRGRYVYEHVYVYWKKTGYLPGPGEVVHHINEDRRDNHSENLTLKTKSKHSKDHAKTVPPVVLTCLSCGRTFTRKPNNARFKEKKGTMQFCSRPCIGAARGVLY